MRHIRKKAAVWLLALALLLAMGTAALAAEPALTSLTISADGLVLYNQAASGTLELPAGVSEVQIDYTLAGESLTVTCGGTDLPSGSLVSVTPGDTLELAVSNGEQYTIAVVYAGRADVACALSVVPEGTANSAGQIFFVRGDTLVYDVCAEAAAGENIGSWQFTLDYESAWLELVDVEAENAALEYRDAGGKVTAAAVTEGTAGLAMTGAPVRLARVTLRVIAAPAVNTERMLAPTLNNLVVTPRGYDGNDGAVTQTAGSASAVLCNRGAPSVTPVQTSGAGKSDGKITGTDDTMEYSRDGGNTWTRCTGAEITGLPAGSYQVRYAELDGRPAGPAATVRVTDPSGGTTGGGGITPPPEEPKECPRDETCPIEPFTDTENDFWWHDGIHYCLEHGLMVGVGDKLFAPNGTTTRAMIVTILWRLEGSPAVDYAMSFADVAEEQWYTEAIRWAQSTGVVLGYSDEAFGPNDNITREQLAAILHRYANGKGIDTAARSDLAQFTDTDEISAWAVENLRWANAAGLVNGRTETTLVPRANATRAEAACMIQRFCENVLELEWDD